MRDQRRLPISKKLPKTHHSFPTNDIVGIHLEVNETLNPGYPAQAVHPSFQIETKRDRRDTYMNAPDDPSRIEPYVVSRFAISGCTGVPCPYKNDSREGTDRDFENRGDELGSSGGSGK